MNRNRSKRWYCIEIVDEEAGVHSIISTFTNEDHAVAMLHETDRRLPFCAHIYCWEADMRPVSRPPNGYSEGPMAGTGSPAND